ncbi:pyruvate formate-lyase-activating protein [Roseofilum reptotaenium CS-1145]|uniref:Pyruvate formate-lyase-activating enzyme n=1 Tax=Roseofilum reptotaenium AO1-A TaxID=1925591 RepID=A0A1L9QNT8_9CYAN|nr:pyruvate formate-lyase-activating protein [Roseofilum reptotaenium]MDB9520037.1 pyruvate formate-lyase-activating protein [Roseofilum reptotaenium CS-1145]OJJ24312.1 pyruvate formate-lyase 1-activating enzyme [Roseofilum reptotaenium AO1-A]
MGSTGIIHSIETCGTVDGPGIRFVIFTKGCPLRCLYCHNPDSRCIKDGEAISVDELMVEIEKYRSYFQFSGGGVTLTGGEPLMQPEFVKDIFQRCHQIGVHTALDTSGYISLEMAKPVLDYTDLVLLDIKSFDPKIYQKVTHVSIEPTLAFARYLNEIQKPTWIRFVLVPGLTDPLNNVNGLAQFVAPFENVEKVEVLPFHKMGEYKWQQLGYDYQLKNTEPPSQELLEQTIGIFKRHNLVVQ